jgi:signal transduction histidine kinase
MVTDGDQRKAAFGLVPLPPDEAARLEARHLHRMESLGALAEGIAHDLNNALAPVLIALDFLKRIHLDARSQRLISAAQASADRGARMVQQILEFAHGAGADEGLVQAHHLMKEMEKLARETFSRTIQVAAYLPKNLHMVAGDATQIHQVLLNLCVNARDAMPEGGTLTLSARNVELDDSYAARHPGARAGRYVALAITDTGAGIPADAQRSIFEPFFTTKENGKGIGLGLSTSLRIVERHRGFIAVESEVGKGSTFIVYLPASRLAS